MQIEVYRMTADSENLTITLEAVCDSFSSLLWDIEYYQCGRFEVYIAANPRNIEIFKTGRIVGRDDDKEHFGIIESVKIETDAENGDYLTVSGRFLMCFLERRIIYPTCSFTSQISYFDIVRFVVLQNAISDDNRKIPGLSLGSVSGDCWEQKTKLQVSYDNLMEWIYTICEKIGGTANIRLSKVSEEQYEMVLDLSEGTDRSIMQSENPHIIFSDGYTNLLSFTYSSDISAQRNFAYVLGKGEGAERKRTTYFDGNEPSFLERYEVYVDANGTDGVDGKNGADGRNGVDGRDGRDGVNGQNGTDGENGLSAYELAVQEGYTGTEKDWLLSLKGRNGIDGKTVELRVYNNELQYRWLDSSGHDVSMWTHLFLLSDLNGKSAYEIAAENGFTGSEEEWLQSITPDLSPYITRVEVLKIVDDNG